MNLRPGDHSQETPAGPGLPRGYRPSTPLMRLSRTDALLLALAIESFLTTPRMRLIPSAARNLSRIRDDICAQLLS